MRNLVDSRDRLQLRIPGEITQLKLQLPSKVALRVLSANVGAQAVARSLAASIPSIEVCADGDDSRGVEGAHLLLYLSRDTFPGFESKDGGQAEVAAAARQALAERTRVLLVQECDERMGALPLEQLIAATPPDIVEGGLYDAMLPVSWHQGMYRDVSLCVERRSRGSYERFGSGAQLACRLPGRTSTYGHRPPTTPRATGRVR